MSMLHVYGHCPSPSLLLLAAEWLCVLGTDDKTRTAAAVSPCWVLHLPFSDNCLQQRNAYLAADNDNSQTTS